MNLTVRIPDDFAERLGSGDLGRKALEALARQEYRAGRLTIANLRHGLGLTTQAEVDTFLSAHGVTPTSPVHPPEHDLAARIRLSAPARRSAALTPSR